MNLDENTAEQADNIYQGIINLIHFEIEPFASLEEERPGFSEKMADRIAWELAEEGAADTLETWLTGFSRLVAQAWMTID